LHGVSFGSIRGTGRRDIGVYREPIVQPGAARQFPKRDCDLPIHVS
jgi:hypothetical protein